MTCSIGFKYQLILLCILSIGMLAAPSKSHAQDGLLGPVRIGPSIGVGVPHPLSYGLDLIYANSLSMGFTTGMFSTNFDNAEIELQHWALRFRWHVFNGSFFVGSSYGEQNLSAKGSQDVTIGSQGFTSTVPTTAEIDIHSKYVTPHFGWLWVWDSGFSLGFELGLQLPQSSSTDFNVMFSSVSADEQEAVRSTEEYQNLERRVQDAGDLIGKSPLLHLTLLRMGWYF